MGRSMEISLRLSGLEQASSGLRRYAEDVAAAEKAAKSLQAMDPTRAFPQVPAVTSPGVAQALKPPPSLLQVKPPGFLAGPNQQLRKIAEQRGRLHEIADPERRQEVARDLDRQERNARRSITLDQRRAADPNAMNGPGLLELFTELNGLMKGLTGGGPVGAVRALTAGVRMLSASRGPGAGDPFELLKARAGLPANLPNMGPSVAQRNATELQGLFAPKRGPQLSDFAIPGMRPRMAAPPVIGPSPGLEGELKLGTMAARVAGPLALVATAATVGVVALKALADATIMAAENLAGIGSAANHSGGSSQDVSRLMGLGLSKDQIPSVAAGFRNKIAEDPFARSTAAGWGISALPRELRGVNEAALLQKGIEGLRAEYKANVPIMGEQRAALEQLRKAQVTGLESVLDLARVSDRVWGEMKKDGEVLAKVADPASVKSAAELGVELKRQRALFEGLNTTISKPFIRDATNALAGFNQGLRDLIESTDGLQKWADKSVVPGADPDKNQTPWKLARDTGINAVFGAAGPAIVKWLNDQEKKNKATDPAAQATRDLADTMRETNRIMSSGVHGGGPGARSAIPRELHGQMLDAAIAGNTIRTGGFRL